MTGTEDRDDDIALTGEYALHLMDGTERRAFETRLTNEPDLRALLREWDEGLIPLTDGVAAVAPPPYLKSRIETLLFASDAKQATSGWFGGRFGIGHLLAGTLAVLLVVFLLNTQFSSSDPTYMAEIASEDQALVIQASLADTDQLTLARTAGAAVPGRVLELWLIAEGADAPVSLGVLPDDPSVTIEVSEELLALLEGGTLAVSDEPPGGSPTGLPTGAVLAAGQIQTI